MCASHFGATSKVKALRDHEHLLQRSCQFSFSIELAQLMGLQHNPKCMNICMLQRKKRSPYVGLSDLKMRAALSAQWPSSLAWQDGARLRIACFPLQSHATCSAWMVAILTLTWPTLNFEVASLASNVLWENDPQPSVRSISQFCLFKPFHNSERKQAENQCFKMTHLIKLCESAIWCLGAPMRHRPSSSAASHWQGQHIDNTTCE